MYIKRHLETTIEKLSGCCKVLLVTSLKICNVSRGKDTS